MIFGNIYCPFIQPKLFRLNIIFPHQLDGLELFTALATTYGPIFRVWLWDFRPYVLTSDLEGAKKVFACKEANHRPRDMVGQWREYK